MKSLTARFVQLFGNIAQFLFLKGTLGTRLG